MARKYLEEPERWITINGEHLPVYSGGRIGSPGQKEPTQKKSTKSVFGNDTDTKIKEYTDKYLKKRSDKEIQELKANLNKSTKITGTTAQDQIAYAAIEKELESRKSSNSSTTSKNVDYNKSVDDLRQDMKDMAASGKYKTSKQLEEAYVDYLSKMPASKRRELGKHTGGRGGEHVLAMAFNESNHYRLPGHPETFNERVKFNEHLRQLAKTNMQSSKPSTTSRNARYNTSNASLTSKNSSALKTMYKNASPEEQKRIGAELAVRGFYQKDGKWYSKGGGR